MFEAPDCVEKYQKDGNHHPCFFGKYIMEADVRLFTTLIRYDAGLVNAVQEQRADDSGREVLFKVALIFEGLVLES